VLLHVAGPTPDGWRVLDVDPTIQRERELARFRLHLVRHRTTLKDCIHYSLMTFGSPFPVSDLFGHEQGGAPCLHERLIEPNLEPAPDRARHLRDRKPSAHT